MSQAQQAAAECSDERLVSRTFPDRRQSDRRGVLDTRTVVDIDPTQASLNAADRRHGDRRQFAEQPPVITGFGDLEGPTFLVDGSRFSRAEMMEANSDDEDFCEWATAAKVGECYPSFVGCRRVA